MRMPLRFVSPEEMTGDPLLPSWETVEVDKIPGSWVLTWWLPDSTAILRLKVEHTCGLDPDSCVAQVKFEPGDQEFQSIGEFMVALYDLLHPEESDSGWRDDLPDVWTEEFQALVEVWGQLQRNVEFGSTFSSP
jgi:hypothetical protein